MIELIWAGPAANVSAATHCATFCCAALLASGDTPAWLRADERASKEAALDFKMAGKKASNSSSAAPCKATKVIVIAKSKSH